MGSVTGANGREAKRREIAERYSKAIGGSGNGRNVSALEVMIGDMIQQAKAEIRAEASAGGVKVSEPEIILFEIKDSWGDTLSLEFVPNDESPFDFRLNRDEHNESVCVLPTRGQVAELRDKLTEILAASERD